MTEDHSTERRAAMALLKAGAANLSEVSRLAGVSRQAVGVWVKNAGIDWRSIRDARLAVLWARKVKRPDA